MRRRGSRLRGLAVNTIPNTFIGGMATWAPDKATLASKFGVSESIISYFNINGNDIEVNFNSDYSLRGQSIYNIDSFTFFHDLENKLISTNTQSIYLFGVGYNFTSIKLEGLIVMNGSSTFRGDKGLRRLYLKNCTTIYFTGHFSAMNIDRIYLGRVTQMGASATSNDLFVSSTVGKIYAHASMATINAGSPDGDLVGKTVTYVQNYTEPDAITDLSYNGVDTTLNFTFPNSLNALDFYEVEVNGFFKQEITGSGTPINGLISGDKVQVLSCDIYWNRSKSNIITI